MAVDDEEGEKPSPKKRKLTKAAQAKLKAKERKKLGKKGSDDEDGDEDAYTALSKSLWTDGTAKPPVGSFENCAVCGKQFTVVCPLCTHHARRTRWKNATGSAAKLNT